MEITAEEIMHSQLAEDLKLRQRRISTKEFLAASAELERGFSDHLRGSYMRHLVSDEVAQRTFNIAMGIQQEIADDAQESINYFAVEKIYSMIADVANMSL